MVIRTIEKDDIEAALKVWSQAFEHGGRNLDGWRSLAENPPEGTFGCGVFDDDGLQATTVVNHYRIHLGPDAIVTMGGIGAVACLPAKRGKGYAGAVLKYSLEQMRDRGILTSFLFPFSWAYYRQFGWEWVGERRNYKVATTALKAIPETENVRSAGPEDSATVQEIYRKFAIRYRGMVARPEDAWNDILADKPDKFTFTYLYEADGEPQGYLTFRGGDGDNTWLREFACLTPEAYGALLGLLKRHEMQVRHFSWKAPSDDILWGRLYHWDIETKVQPVTQGRVVDLVGALQAYHAPRAGSGAVVFAVQDDAAPWNTGTWRAEFDGPKVSVKPTDGAPQVSMDIQALSQALFGLPTPDWLRAAGRLAVHDEAGFAALKTLLDGPPMYINDDF